MSTREEIQACFKNAGYIWLEMIIDAAEEIAILASNPDFSKIIISDSDKASLKASLISLKQVITEQVSELQGSAAANNDAIIDLQTQITASSIVSDVNNVNRILPQSELIKSPLLLKTIPEMTSTSLERAAEQTALIYRYNTAVKFKNIIAIQKDTYKDLLDRVDSVLFLFA